MEFLTDYSTIPAFMVIIYLLAEIFKKVTRDSRNEFIPALCGLVGAVLAVIAFFTVPNYIPAENLFEAVAIGIVSGLATTGVNQIYKQASDNAKG